MIGRGLQNVVADPTRLAEQFGQCSSMRACQRVDVVFVVEPRRTRRNPVGVIEGYLGGRRRIYTAHVKCLSQMPLHRPPDRLLAYADGTCFVADYSKNTILRIRRFASTQARHE